MRPWSLPLLWSLYACAGSASVSGSTSAKPPHARQDAPRAHAAQDAQGPLGVTPGSYQPGSDATASAPAPTAQTADPATQSVTPAIVASASRMGASPVSSAKAAPVAALPPTAPPAPGGVPPVIEGPDIPRSALLAVLSRGIGRFLQTVRAEPDLERGRFVGWRLVSVFDNSPELSRGALLPGDTVLRVNGQSIERPEQFKNVWDRLATESQLILQIRRAGKASEIRHRILP